MYRVACIIVCVLNILCSFWLITEYLSPLQSFVFDCLFYLSLFSGLGLGVYTIIKSKSICMKIAIAVWMIAIGIGLFILHSKSDVERMAEHYEKYHSNIAELKNYTKLALDSNCMVQIEVYKRFGEDAVSFACATSNQEYLEFYSDDYEHILPSIGLSKEDLDTILILLNKADCIGVKVYRSAEVEVFWRRPNYLDLYTFLLCNESMSNTQWNEYLDSYSHIPYCDTVVFRYGGPAFGTDIIPKKDKEDFILNHEIKKR